MTNRSTNRKRSKTQRRTTPTAALTTTTIADNENGNNKRTQVGAAVFAAAKSFAAVDKGSCFLGSSGKSSRGGEGMGKVVYVVERGRTLANTIKAPKIARQAF